MKQCIKSLRLNHLGNVPFCFRFMARTVFLQIECGQPRISGHHYPAVFHTVYTPLCVICCKPDRRQQDFKGWPNRFVMRELLIQNCKNALRKSTPSKVTVKVPLSNTLNPQQLQRSEFSVLRRKLWGLFWKWHHYVDDNDCFSCKLWKEETVFIFLMTDRQRCILRRSDLGHRHVKAPPTKVCSSRSFCVFFSDSLQLKHKNAAVGWK